MRPKSSRLFPNRAGYFHSTRLSRDGAPPVLGWCGLHRTRWACPPSPAALPPVLGITPGLRVLRPLCHLEGLPLEAVPLSHVYAGPSVGVLFAGFPDQFG
jgi:hypothetical protein